MISVGTGQTSSFRRPEKIQSGRYVARLFDALNHHAKAKVAKITGPAITIMIATESSRISLCAVPTGRCGAITPLHPGGGYQDHAADGLS